MTYAAALERQMPIRQDITYAIFTPDGHAATLNIAFHHGHATPEDDSAFALMKRQSCMAELPMIEAAASLRCSIFLIFHFHIVSLDAAFFRYEIY
jgi:hypothetical protein